MVCVAFAVSLGNSTTSQFSMVARHAHFRVLAIGSVFTFIYLTYLYIKSQSVWVNSLAHITMYNAAASFSYFSILENKILANFGLMLRMTIVVAILYYRQKLMIFSARFNA